MEKTKIINEIESEGCNDLKGWRHGVIFVKKNKCLCRKTQKNIKVQLDNLINFY